MPTEATRVYATLPTTGAPKLDDSNYNIDFYVPRLPWSCDFGYNMQMPNLCGFQQDKQDDFNWLPNINGTETLFTGPKEENYLEHGLNQINYLL